MRDYHVEEEGEDGLKHVSVDRLLSTSVKDYSYHLQNASLAQYLDHILFAGDCAVAEEFHRQVESPDVARILFALRYEQLVERRQDGALALEEIYDLRHLVVLPLECACKHVHHLVVSHACQILKDPERLQLHVVELFLW